MSSLVNRRRTTPWIHRWSRPLIGAIAILGAIITAYLTFARLTNTDAACPTEGCSQVLASSYATVFGLPLSLFGFLAYLGMATFALGPLAISPEKNRQLRTNLDQWTWLLLFIGATAMTVFSGYLMYIMFSQFVSQFGAGGICYFCLASAIFALSMFVLTLIGRAWDDIGQLLFIGVIVVMVTLVGTLAVYSGDGSNGDPAAQIRSGNGQVFFTIKNTSGPAEIELVRHLNQVGAKMYSAYWCPHCYEQKELLGVQAARQLNYIECAPDGINSQTALCQKIIPEAEKQTGQKFGFPTWEINGKYYSGTQSLQKLADLSGYKGPRNFQN
ncbi:vitamin K epoxide reductase family protein [Leptothermofonsia sichuanensis E412]|uniref:vitamin K epoxide reductase family protein n=1 Tax=Leptothermofonsia sichuanensis TaxID=2917832 RepID=UPI001CA66248|nr:vitamin K epoxide reductase family protein [Leptothermofonsia sichuanensis]QZZ21377.1 vitamin K epoxide reductase family protein [Leptothermofonsia sichuanensis E412]